MKAFCVRIIVTLAIFGLTSSCAESKELTRSRAKAIINDAKEFKEPTAIVLREDYGEVSVTAQSADEEETAAQQRAVEAFLDNHPALAVLKYLGLIDFAAQLIQKPQVIKAPEIRVERPNGTMARTPLGRDSLEPWKFDIRVSLTEKGQKAAGSDKRSIPLYTRRVIDVTGIIKTQNGGAQAEFTWQAVPTAVGEAFDPTSEEYKNLPLQLQQGLRKPTGLLQRTPLADTSEINTAIKRGVAYFQRYDDGWRLISVQ